MNFIITLLICILLSSIFFSVLNYVVTTIGFLLFILPVAGIIIIGFKFYTKKGEQS
jgi:hypothetical protein